MSAEHQAVQGVAALGDLLLQAVLASLEVNQGALLDNLPEGKLVELQVKLAEPTGHEQAEEPEAWEVISLARKQFVDTLMGYLTLQEGRPAVLRKISSLYTLVVVPAVVQELVASEKRKGRTC